MMGEPRDREFARFYDLEYRGHFEDLDFYVQYTSMLDPERALPVLELGCGTGRVSIALAAAGFNVVGVDASEGMLAVCARHVEAAGVQNRITLVRGNMRALPDLPGAPFNLALCALNTFAYLTSTADQLAMLGAVRSALVQHGILILDLTPSLCHLLPPADGEVLYQGSYLDEETGETLHKFVSGYAHPAKQLHQIRLFYDLEASDGTLRRFTKDETFRWSGRYEMELLLQAAGYRVEKIYGDYQLEEYGDDSERMIFVART